MQHGASFFQWLLDRVVSWIIIPLARSSRLVSLFFLSLLLGVLHTSFLLCGIGVHSPCGPARSSCIDRNTLHYLGPLSKRFEHLDRRLGNNNFTLVVFGMGWEAGLGRVRPDIYVTYYCKG